MTASEISAGTGTTARLITPANLKVAIQTWQTTDLSQMDNATSKFVSESDIGDGRI